MACNGSWQGLELLAGASGLRPRSGAPLPRPATHRGNLDALGSWVEQACRQLNLEAEPVEIPYNAVERPCHAGPALLMLSSPDGASFLALVETGGGWRSSWAGMVDATGCA